MFREFPSYRRTDTHLWSRWRFYPVGFFLLIPRFLIAFTFFLLYGAVARVCYYGRDMDRPLDGWRLLVFRYFCNKFLIRFIIFGGNIKVDYTNHDEVDYSKYLGPKWKENKFTGKNVATMVSNHIGFWEQPIYMAYCPKPPGYVTAHFVKYFPIGHFYCQAV